MRGFFLILSIALLEMNCTSSTTRLEEYEVHGIDVSHYQSLVDWERIAQQDIDFAYVKATEGEGYVDSLFQVNWNAIKESGMKRGAYHFFIPSFSIDLQAANYIKTVNLEVGDLAPVVDVEGIDGVTQKELIDRLTKFIHLLEASYNTKPVIYTYQKFYNKYLAGHFDDYPIWIARYSSRKPVLADNAEWHFWQYGSRGNLEGIKGNVDFNVFRGSLEALNNLCIPAKSPLTETNMVFHNAISK
jgi:lysozyme